MAPRRGLVRPLDSNALAVGWTLSCPTEFKGAFPRVSNLPNPGVPRQLRASGTMGHELEPPNVSSVTCHMISQNLEIYNGRLGFGTLGQRSWQS